jgi:hypothetical protein
MGITGSLLPLEINDTGTNPLVSVAPSQAIVMEPPSPSAYEWYRQQEAAANGLAVSGTIGTDAASADAIPPGGGMDSPPTSSVEAEADSLIRTRWQDVGAVTLSEQPSGEQDSGLMKK